MKLAGRLKKLEAQAAARPPQVVWLDEDGWLEQYAAWGAEGCFAHEPDFEKALAEYRGAIEQARLSADPPWLPPADFEIGAIDGSWVREAIRRQNWRYRHFPQVAAALDWLDEMRWRTVHGIPPVSEAEFAELAAWHEANAARLDALADRSPPMQLLDVGAIGDSLHRTRVRSWMVKYDLRAGPRAEDSGRCAETIRRLRALFPATEPAAA